MTKDKVLDTVSCIGKAAVRGAVRVGTTLAFAGGGVVASLLLAGRVKNQWAQVAIYAGGMSCSALAAYFAADVVDDYLRDECALDVDGI